MDLTPTLSRFDDFYKDSAQSPLWVIGEPQQAVVELEPAWLARVRRL